MKIVKVTYTTRAAFAAQNLENIKEVMNELQQLEPAGIFYHACLGTDGKTFIHTAFFETDSGQQQLNGLASFKKFQAELKASEPEQPPQPELLTLAGSSKPIF